MPITLNCQCGKRLRVPDNLLGRRVGCPKCSTVLVVAEPEPELDLATFEDVTDQPEGANVSAGVGNVFVADDGIAARKSRPTTGETAVQILRTTEGKIVAGALLFCGLISLGSIFAPDALRQLGAFAIAAVLLVAAILSFNALPNGAYQFAVIPLISLFIGSPFWQLASAVCLAIFISAGIIVETIKRTVAPPAA